MEYATATTQVQAQVVESGVDPLRIVIGGVVAKQRCFQQQHTAEVEIVAHTACLIIDDGMAHHLSAFHLIAGGIDHRGVGLYGHAQQPLDSIEPQRQRTILQTEQRIASFCRCTDFAYRSRRHQPPQTTDSQFKNM